MTQIPDDARQKLDYERLESPLPRRDRLVEGFSTLFTILIILVLVAGAVWLAYVVSSFA